MPMKNYEQNRKMCEIINGSGEIVSKVDLKI